MSDLSRYLKVEFYRAFTSKKLCSDNMLDIFVVSWQHTQGDFPPWQRRCCYGPIFFRSCQ